MFIRAFIPQGAEGTIVRVEADIRRGLPVFDMSGLAEGAVRESRERIRAAFRNAGFPFPQDRVLVNLAPAGLRKSGTALDLAIALAIMVASDLVPCPAPLLVMGELELSGAVRAVSGVVAAIAAGLDEGLGHFMVPRANEAEARILDPGATCAVASLVEALEALCAWNGSGEFPSLVKDPGGRGDMPSCRTQARNAHEALGDFNEVVGAARYKRALEIQAAGGHNLMVFGPPGGGKTMLARRVPTIMPPLVRNEAVEVTRIYSLAGLLGEGEGLITRPPFRAPHHSASLEGLLGGGRQIRPGEISLAHRGVLFLDEAAEFRKNVLQALREPLEDGVVTISRADGSRRLPASFQLLVAVNPCPCGRLGLGDSSSCLCSGDDINRYWKRLGGALLDRVELRVPLPRSDSAPSAKAVRGESSAQIARRVAQARRIQEERGQLNARMGPAALDTWCALEGSAARALFQAAGFLGLSARAGVAVRRVARTIADLDGREQIGENDVLEAVQHRRYGDSPWDILAFDKASSSASR